MPAGLAPVPGESPDASRTRVWAPAGEADLLLANFECPVTTHAAPRTAKRFNFKADPATLDLLDPRGIYSLANNHIMDFGPEGLRDTLAAFRARGLACAGAGMNLEEARRPVFRETGGRRIAVLCAADPRHAPAYPDTPGSCPARPDLLRAGLQEARRQADLCVVSIHMGMEYLPYPGAAMRALAGLCLVEGARLVVFHHAHCLSGHTADARGTVLWGTGNYLFPKGPADTCRLLNESAVWRVRLGGAPPRADDVEIRPVLLDAAGWPGPADARTAACIRRRVAALSDAISRGRGLGWRRWAAALNPSYLRLTLPNYAHILRTHGPGALIRTVVSGLTSHAAPPGNTP